MNGAEVEAEAEPRENRRALFRRAPFWSGALVIACGVLIASLSPLGVGDTAAASGFLLLVAGSAEMVGGAASRRAGRSSGGTDVVLGLVSLLAAALLIASTDRASSLVALIAAWLAMRGMIGTAAAILLSDAHIGEARLARASVDLLLALIAWIATEVVAWWELLFGWPSPSVASAMMLAGIGLVVCGTFLVSASAVNRNGPFGSEARAS